MKTKTKVLVLLLVVFMLFSIGAKYYKFAIANDYYISAAVACDPETESCFVWDCSIEEDEDCDQSPYMYMYTHASELSECNPYENDNCPDLTCPAESTTCEMIPCSLDELGEDEYCIGVE